MRGVRSSEGELLLNINCRIDIPLDTVHEPYHGVGLNAALVLPTSNLLAICERSLDHLTTSCLHRDVSEWRQEPSFLEVKNSTACVRFRYLEKDCDLLLTETRMLLAQFDDTLEIYRVIYTGTTLLGSGTL